MYQLILKEILCTYTFFEPFLYQFTKKFVYYSFFWWRLQRPSRTQTFSELKTIKGVLGDSKKKLCPHIHFLNHSCVSSPKNLIITRFFRGDSNVRTEHKLSENRRELKTFYLMLVYPKNNTIFLNSTTGNPPNCGQVQSSLI